MPYLDTIDEDLARAKAILAAGKPSIEELRVTHGLGLEVAERLADRSGGTIYGKDTYAAYKLLESFIAEIERLQLITAENVQTGVTAALKTIRCDCGTLMTQCGSCAVADWQAAHPECPTCCPPQQGRAPTDEPPLSDVTSWQEDNEPTIPFVPHAAPDEPPHRQRQCERCGGTGQQYPGLWNMETQAYDTKAGTCDDCKGTGRLEA